MFDLHTHTVFSDGGLIPAESARRFKHLGYKGMAFTDHADESNYAFVLENMLRFCEAHNKTDDEFKVIAGVEITHVPPVRLGAMADKCRDAGAQIIVVHGETVTEPVEPGTNRQAVLSDVDVLAHPGELDDETVEIGIENGIYFELTTRRGHNKTNQHVADIVRKHGGKLVLNNDFHAPGDAVTPERAVEILTELGLSKEEIIEVLENNRQLFQNILGGDR